MKAKYFLPLLGMFLGALTGVKAQNNKLYIPHVNAIQGNKVPLAIHLDNESQITALQFEVTLPTQVSLSAHSATLSSDRKTDHELRARDMGSGRYLLMIYSPTNTPL